MTDDLVSGLVILAGLISAGVGITIATSRFRAAARAYRKTGTLCETMPEGWGSWFLEGFSGLTMGTHSLRAVAALAGWALAGLCLIGLGLLLFWRG